MAIKYKWLAGRLREQLPDYTANGIHRLPTEAAISQRYKVSRQTVRQALSVLEQEGLIEKRQGSGSYITGRSRGEDRIDLLLSSDSVSYTHLDVYKRQPKSCTAPKNRPPISSHNNTGTQPNTDARIGPVTGPAPAMEEN